MTPATPQAVENLDACRGVGDEWSQRVELAAAYRLVDHFGWKDLTAVRKGKVFAVDGHHLFNRPGPRLVESAELIAQLVGATPTQALEMGRDWISIDGV